MRGLCPIWFSLCLYGAIATGSDHLFEAVIRKNHFCTSRSLKDYLQTFDVLKDLLDAMGDDYRILDLGGGECQAMLDIKNRYPHSKLTCLTYIISDKRRDELLDKGISVIAGRFFEAIDITEFDEYDLILDLFGVLSYTNKLGLVLNKCLNLLKPNGRLLIRDHMMLVEPVYPRLCQSCHEHCRYSSDISSAFPCAGLRNCFFQPISVRELLINACGPAFEDWDPRANRYFFSLSKTDPIDIPDLMEIKRRKTSSAPLRRHWLMHKL